MKVRIRWSEEIEYTSDIDIDEAEYLGWIGDEPPSNDNLLRFLEEDARDDDGHYIEALTDRKINELTDWVDYTMLEASPLPNPERTPMLYIVKATSDDETSFWHVIHAPQLPSWTEDRTGHVEWWDKHVKPIVGDNVELEITTFANEDYTISTEDIDAIGVEWSFSDYPD